MNDYFRLKDLNKNKIYVLKQPQMVMGRNAFSDISIDSGLLSRQHAEFRVDGERIVLEDLNSTNGTFVNNMRIQQPTELMHGDVVTIGQEKFMIIAPDKNDGSTVFTYNLSQEPVAVLDGEADASSKTQLQKAFPSPLAWSPIASNATGDEQDFNQKIVQQALAQREFDAHQTPAILVVRSDANQGEVYSLSAAKGDKLSWEIGRNNRVDVVIDHPTVSNKHATLSCVDDEWVIADNESTNGLKLNKKRVGRGSCNSGDVISLGNLELIFKAL